MPHILRLLRDLLEPREQKRAALLLLMIIISGLLELLRVASIVPFVAVIADPEVIATNHHLATAYRWLGVQSPQAFLLILGLAIFVIMLGALSFAALTTWATIRFTSMRNYRLSLDLFRVFISRPYDWFLRRHSADLGKSVLSEVNQVISSALMPCISLCVGSVTAGFMLILLLLADPLLAVLVAATLGGSFAAIYAVTRSHLTRLGEERVLANRQRFRISSETFGGIKEVKIMGLERTFVERFEKPSKVFVDRQAASDLLGQLPQYALQVVAFAIVLLIVAYQLTIRGSIGQALPVIALYALAGSRLMPALQTIYQSTSKLRYAQPALTALHRDLYEFVPSKCPPMPRDVSASGLKIGLDIVNVSYTYPGATSNALQNVSLSIPARTAVGLVGQTGAGKTTLVDVILGLLEPQTGQLVVDGEPVTASRTPAWQRSIGYVPQHIFLADDTIAANIAFGAVPNDIDMEAVWRAARIANLHDFVREDLPQSYDTKIGERGVRLSGGQRQRIGIARALFRDPDLIIMDEGTSALDTITERAVMEAFNNLAHAKTIILIAHRLTTVKKCDRIVMLDRGRITASGTYEELVEGNERFRGMAANIP